ncbi:hypothetical protein THIOKS13320010 [Thiocapsa sp. KS1]|nr:hypothetical protein THIOKS13320010 [Thiocapsa sp. KS1]
MSHLTTTVSDSHEPSNADLCQVDLYYALRRANEGDTLLPLSVIAEMLVDCFGKDVRLLANLIALYDQGKVVTKGGSF